MLADQDYASLVLRFLLRLPQIAPAVIRL